MRCPIRLNAAGTTEEEEEGDDGGTGRLRLAAGTEVVTVGLSKAAFNGMRGQVLAFDATKNRYTVALEDAAEWCFCNGRPPLFPPMMSKVDCDESERQAKVMRASKM